MSNHEFFFQSPNRITIGNTIPLVFLEGPVQGADDWQTPFAHHLLDTVEDIAVASPRVTAEHEAHLKSSDPQEKTRASERQVAYEFLARRRAFQFGAIALWYAPQNPSLPYPTGRRYGKTTPIENGEVWGHLMHKPDYPFIVGYDPSFIESGENSRGYISRNHALMGIKEHESLDDVFNATVDAVVSLKTAGLRPIPSLTSRSVRRALDQLGSE